MGNVARHTRRQAITKAFHYSGEWWNAVLKIFRIAKLKAGKLKLIEK
jgi:hypothetical protein